MFKRNTIALAVTAALACTPLARAATDDDLKEIREQVRQMKEQYEKRIDALEKRLQQAEQSAGKAEATAGRAQAAAGNAEATAEKAQVTASQAAVQASSRPASENAMNPGISLILNATYGNLSQDPTAHSIKGFVPTGGEVAPPAKGLSLGESELVISGNIDPNFRGTFIAALGGDNTIGVEEAYIQTLGLSHGLTVKAGRFLGSVGYSNQVHAHAWDFTDTSLANKVFLGGAFIDDGISLKWVAPTELYLDLGVELGRGRAFPGGPSGGRNKNGFSQSTLFAHLGGDIGAGAAWQVGLSQIRTRPQERTYTDTDSADKSITNRIDGNGNTRLSVLDGSSGRPTATRPLPISNCRANISDSMNRASSLTTRRASHRARSRARTHHSSPAGMRRGSISSCRAGASAIVTTSLTRARWASAWWIRVRLVRLIFPFWASMIRSARRLWQTGARASSAAFVCSSRAITRARTRLTTRFSCNTSAVSALMAGTSSKWPLQPVRNGR